MKKKILLVLLFVIVKVEAQTSAFAVADSLFKKGRYKLALQELDKSEASFLMNYKKAVIYESIDDYKKAAQFLEKAVTFKDDENAKLRLAKNYRSLKLSKKAIPIYEEVLAKDSLNLVLKYQLGKLYIINRKPKEAIKTFKYLVENDTENANYSYHLGLSYALNGQRDPMMNSYLDTHEKDATHLNAIVRLANSYKKLKDKDSTQIFVDKGLALDKNHVDLNKLKINQLYLDKKYLETIPLLLNLDTIDKKDTYSAAMLGRSFFNMDSLEQAKKYFKKVSIKDREDFKALTYLGHISMIEKDYRGAMFNYMMATYVGKEKRDEEYFGLGTMYAETNKIPEAINAFKEAYAENRKNYKALYQIAKLSDDYYKDKKIAYNEYKKYIENFYSRDEVISVFVERRIKEIKKEYFLEGELLD